jgi:hypothetical protein
MQPAGLLSRNKGRALRAGQYVEIRWSGGTSARDFSCDRANNYTKNLPAETETLKIKFDPAIHRQ